ncbi:MAG: hypothetical protein MJ208_01500 [Bacilli bacterium]|nr:hypothetical protein [Bacilli bacterium]
MLTKKETLLQNMAFMGIIAAINVLLSALGAYFPVAGIFIMILLPFFSAAVAMLCKWKYYPIYAFASIGVALCATLWNTEFTIFYLIPSIITGFLFGMCFTYKLTGTYSLLLTSIAQLGLTYLALPIIKAIYDVDLINVFLTVFKLDNNPHAPLMVPSFIYLLSLVQMLFSYIVLTNEIKKFTNDSENQNGFYLKIIGLLLAILVIPFAFFALNASYLFMFIALFLTISVFVDIVYTKNRKNIIIYSILLSIGFILIFALFNVIKMPYALLVIDASNILILSLSLLYNQKRAS